MLLQRKDGKPQVYSIVHNREHANVSWIMGEGLRLRPEEDTLTIREGILGAYPNMFFVLDERQADAFSKAVAGISSRDDYDRLVDQFGVKAQPEPVLGDLRRDRRSRPADGADRKGHTRPDTVSAGKALEAPTPGAVARRAPSCPLAANRNSQLLLLPGCP